MSTTRGERYTPDRRVGGMSEAEKGKGKLHLLHEGEIVLNRATTKRLLDVLGLAKDTAMKMAPASLMKKVKQVIDIADRGMNKDKETAAPRRQTGGMARPARVAPSRKTGGMSRPARSAPSRAKGGMAAPGTSEARAEREQRLGRHAFKDTL